MRFHVMKKIIDAIQRDLSSDSRSNSLEYDIQLRSGTMAKKQHRSGWKNKYLNISITVIVENTFDALSSCFIIKVWKHIISHTLKCVKSSIHTAKTAQFDSL